MTLCAYFLTSPANDLAESPQVSGADCETSNSFAKVDGPLRGSTPRLPCTGLLGEFQFGGRDHGLKHAAGAAADITVAAAVCDRCVIPPKSTINRRTMP